MSMCFTPYVELDIVDTESSPGVRRMQALVGQEVPFDRGREQIEVLAGSEVTTKAVERTAEAVGGDLAQRQQQEIQRAVQLDLPIVVGQPIPILYVQMDGTGVPVVKKETERRKGQHGWTAGPYARSQAGMRVHPNQVGPRCCHLNGRFEDYWEARRAA